MPLPGTVDAGGADGPAESEPSAAVLSGRTDAEESVRPELSAPLARLADPDEHPTIEADSAATVTTVASALAAWCRSAAFC